MIIDINSIFSFNQLGNRETQEDSRYPNNDNPGNDSAAFVVCDGVGGCDKGEVASSTVCSKIGDMIQNHKNTDKFSCEDLKKIISYAYDSLDHVSNPSNLGMGTTLTLLVIHSQGVMGAHIGDSRIYQIRPNEGIIYRSEDHSLVNALLRSGNISPEEVKGHPKNNVITRCMSANDGTRNRDNATVINLKDIAPGDYFLLCTDGVTNMVEDEELIEVYSTDKTDEEKINYLSNICKESDDNNTLVQVHIGHVTVDPEIENNELEESSINEDSSINIVNTQELKSNFDSIKELSPSKINYQSKIKSIFSKILKF